jgi:hypothetical protein
MNNVVVVLIAAAGGIGLLIGFLLGSIERREIFGPVRLVRVTTSRKAPEPTKVP